MARLFDVDIEYKKSMLSMHETEEKNKNVVIFLETKKTRRQIFKKIRTVF